MARAATPPRVAALVVALERAPGERFIPALAVVRGRPLYAWSVDRLAATPAISETHVLLPARARARFERIAAAAGWRGVTERAVTPDTLPPAAALLEALGTLDGAIERLLLHDATYPLFDSGALEAVLVANSLDWLAIAATPVQDTLKTVGAQGMVTDTPPRDLLWQVQSPVLAPRALLEGRLRQLAHAASPSDHSRAAIGDGWLRAACAGLPARIVPIGADAPHVRTRADARALAQALPLP